MPLTDEEKMELVYGVGGEKYQTAEEAEANMVEISVPVWRLQEDGTKTSGTAYLQVNSNLASIYEAIFEEIYNGDEQFPIKDVGCYSWRTGEHSQGTAVDINWEENMEANHQRGWFAHADHRLLLAAGRRSLFYPRGRRCVQCIHQSRLPVGRQRMAQQARLYAFQLFRYLNTKGPAGLAGPFSCFPMQ